jgi:hypothetical protein
MSALVESLSGAASDGEAAGVMSTAEGEAVNSSEAAANSSDGKTSSSSQDANADNEDHTTSQDGNDEDNDGDDEEADGFSEGDDEDDEAEGSSQSSNDQADKYNVSTDNVNTVQQNGSTIPATHPSLLPRGNHGNPTGGMPDWNAEPRSPVTPNPSMEASEWAQPPPTDTGVRPKSTDHPYHKDYTQAEPDYGEPEQLEDDESDDVANKYNGEDSDPESLFHFEPDEN